MSMMCRNQRDCKRPALDGCDGLCERCFIRRFFVTHPLYGDHEYIPTDKQLEFHTCPAPNVMLEGARGTGKSVAIRNDAHMRAMAVPGLTYLIIRRTMPELRKTHLKFIDMEMKRLGGRFNKTEGIAYYPNGSLGFFGHCETEDDVMKLLSSEYAVIYFDEITTFTQKQIQDIGTCCRVPEGSGLLALIRSGTNPIGVGADFIRSYYIAKDVDPMEDDEYNPDDFVAISTKMEDNPHIDEKQYRKKFAGMPEHIRQAWLEGEWIMEGAYFSDFKPVVKGPDGVAEVEWHVIKKLPKIKHEGRLVPFYEFVNQPWVKVYRAVDWGFFPDPACCLWVAILPSGREIVFHEDTWFRHTAANVAEKIKEQSEDMRIAETFCDPRMFDNEEATGHSVGGIFEMNGVPLTKSKNDRAAAGFAIHEHLNTIMEDGFPKLQIYVPGPKRGCFMLYKTMPTLRMDKNDPRKIADGNDHWTIALAYFCMVLIAASKHTFTAARPKWMKKKQTADKYVLGRHNIRRH